MWFVFVALPVVFVVDAAAAVANSVFTRQIHNPLDAMFSNKFNLSDCDQAHIRRVPILVASLGSGVRVTSHKSQF